MHLAVQFEYKVARRIAAMTATDDVVVSDVCTRAIAIVII